MTRGTSFEDAATVGAMEQGSIAELLMLLDVEYGPVTENYLTEAAGRWPDAQHQSWLPARGDVIDPSLNDVIDLVPGPVRDRDDDPVAVLVREFEDPVALRPDQLDVSAQHHIRDGPVPVRHDEVRLSGPKDFDISDKA
jgi:hypothetical protein